MLECIEIAKSLASQRGFLPSEGNVGCLHGAISSDWAQWRGLPGGWMGEGGGEEGCGVWESVGGVVVEGEGCAARGTTVQRVPWCEAAEQEVSCKEQVNPCVHLAEVWVGSRRRFAKRDVPASTPSPRCALGAFAQPQCGKDLTEAHRFTEVSKQRSATRRLQKPAPRGAGKASWATPVLATWAALGEGGGSW